jgi:hypothetical protein
MKTVLGIVVLAGALSGCTAVSSAMPGMSTATGEAWYSKDTTMFGLTLESNIYYCSKETPGICRKAVWYGHGEAGPQVGDPPAAPGAPPAPVDANACEDARKYAQRVTAMPEGAPREQIERLAKRKQAECDAQQAKGGAPATNP